MRFGRQAEQQHPTLKTEADNGSRFVELPNNTGHSIPENPQVFLGMPSLRQRMADVRHDLVGKHPNPGTSVKEERGKHRRRDGKQIRKEGEGGGEGKV